MRSARKHIGWAVKALPGGPVFRDHLNTLLTCEAQLRALAGFFDGLAQQHLHLPELQHSTQVAAANDPYSQAA